MSDLQEDMQRSAPILWRLWGVLASVFRSHVPSSTEAFQTTKVSTMELCDRLEFPTMGRHMATGDCRRCPMDNVTKKENVIQKEAITAHQTERSRSAKRPQRQRERTCSRSRTLWPTAFAQCSCGTSMAVVYEYDCGHHASSSTEHRRQAAQDHHGSTEEAQRSLASRATIHGQRSCHKGGTTTNETTACSGCSTWQSSEGAPAGATGSFQPPQCMERFPQPGSQAMARLQCPISRPGETDERKGLISDGDLGTSQRGPGQSQVHGWHRGQGGCNGSQRRGPRKRPHWASSRPHQRRLDKSPNQFGGTPKFCRADGRGRAKSLEATQTGRKCPRQRFQAIRHALIASGVWLGRVNNSQVFIAHGPVQHDIDVPSFLPKWLHTVQEEPNFVSEWQAWDAAFHLANEVGTLPSHNTIHDHSMLLPEPAKCDSFDANVETHTAFPPSPFRTHVKRPGRYTVVFSNTVSIRIGEEDTNLFNDFLVDSCALNSSWKPWKITSDKTTRLNFDDPAVTKVGMHSLVGHAHTLQPFWKSGISVPWEHEGSAEVQHSKRTSTCVDTISRHTTGLKTRVALHDTTEYLTGSGMHPGFDCTDPHRQKTRRAHCRHNFAGFEGQAHNLHVPCIIPKWLHTVQSEPNFVSEWSACDDAFHLAHEIGSWLSRCQNGHANETGEKTEVHDGHVTTPQAPRYPTKTTLHAVKFSENVSVRIGDSDTDQFHDYVIQSCALQSKWKPWALHSTPSHEESGEVTAYTLPCISDPVPKDDILQPFVKPAHNGHRSYVRSEELLQSPVPPASLVHNDQVCTAQWSNEGFNLSHLHPPSRDMHSTPNAFTAPCHSNGAIQHCHNVETYDCQSFETPFWQQSPVDHMSPHQRDGRFCRTVSGRPTRVPGKRQDCSFTVSPYGKDKANFDCGTHPKRSLEDQDVSRDTYRAGKIIPPNGLCSYEHSIDIETEDIALIGQPWCQSPELITNANCTAYASSVSDTVSDPTKQHRAYAKVDQSASGHAPRYPHKDTRRVIHAVPYHLWRLEHESPIEEFAASLPEEPQQIGNAPPGNDNNRPVQPAFVDELSAKFMRMGYDVFDRDFDVPVRTWYIDHATIRRWTAPRNLQLVGPPHLWEQQFSSIWVDQLNPLEWFDVIIVSPDPPRSARNAFLIMDLIVTQSLQMNRFPGLITIIPDISDAFDMHSVAASFEPFVSGFEVAQAADATGLCQYRECTVTFGWQEIPFTLRRHHVMANGDGFQLSIRRDPHQAQSSSSQAGSSTDSAMSRITSEEPLPTRPRTSPPNEGNDQALRFTTPLHLFQLEGPEVVVQLLNAQLAQPSHDMAQALRVPLNCIEAIHIMPIAPDGFPELAIPAIVQRVGDLDIHSTDRLIVIDTIYHHHPTPEGELNQPTVVRSVQRVTEEVTRPQILLKAAVLHYCQHLREACAVSLDGFLWPLNHVNPRPVRHGSYATVDVPPPFGTNPDTRALADAFHAEGTTNEFFRWLVEPDDAPEDAMQLTQLFAAKTVISSTIKQRFRWSCRTCPVPPDHAQLTFENQSKVTPDKLAPPSEEPAECIHESAPCNPPHDVAPAQPKAVGVKPDLEDPTAPKDFPNMRDPKVGTAKPPTQKRQTRLSQFFNTLPTPAKTDGGGRSKGQRTIQDYFPPADVHATQRKAVELPPDSHDQSLQPPSASHRVHQPPEGVCEFKCTQDQVVEPPTYTTSQVPAHILPQPQAAPRPPWRIHLGNIFDEYATVIHQETGPVLQIEVWYIHHQTYPECAAPRVLELDDVQELWYADICNLWFDHINRHEPMKVLNVLPPPPHQARPRTAAHIILEQGFSPERLAVHFTAVFLGGTHLGLFQRVESHAHSICTRDMIVKHGFQLQCDYRPCNMHSGYIRFNMDEREEVFSGISVVLSVAPPPVEPRATHSRRQVQAEGAGPDQDMDVSSIMQYTRLQPSNTPPVTPRTAHTYHATTSVPQTDHMQFFDHRMTPAAITEFRATLAWQYSGSTTLCDVHNDELRTVRTWYLHSDRCIRTEESRMVQLRPQAHTWHVDIIQRWSERLDPLYAVHLHVVMPNPPRTSLHQEAHVILVQKPNPLWRSALLTVSQPEQDPWHLTYVCAMLDAETDIGQLSFISGVGHPSNPLASTLRIVARQGQIVVPNEGSFPVRHGYWFDIQAYSVESTLDDEVANIQLQFTTIKKTIETIHANIVRNEQSWMVTSEVSHGTVPTTELSITVWPNDPATYLDASDALSFFTTLQAYWQPLALLNPPAMPALVPVVTWYLDHIRYPQCFQPRLALLNHNPADWIQRIRSVWTDIVLPDHLMTLYIVQPHPPDMPPHFAAHILLVQQPIGNFRSTLITTIDSAFPLEPPRSHASIAPTPVAFSTVTALAYKENDCQHAFNDCAVWVGEEELPQNEERHIQNGQSIILAVHRRPQPIQDEPEIWGQSAEPRRPSEPTACPPPGNEPPWDSKIKSPPCPKVLLSLEAVLPAHVPVQTLDDNKPQLLWFDNHAWLLRLSQQLPCELHPLPNGMRVPDASYWPLVQPVMSADASHDLTLYLDGAANGTHAAWGVIATLSLPEGEAFIGCMHGCVHIDPTHPMWIGADTMDNIAAELTALAMAQTLALRWPYPDHRICIRPDLSLSRLVADAITTCRTNPNLAQVCRIQGLWLASKVHIWEIRGHKGFAWNELADAVAKHALCQGIDVAAPNLEALHHFASCAHDVAWAWMQTTPSLVGLLSGSCGSAGHAIYTAAPHHSHCGY